MQTINLQVNGKPLVFTGQSVTYGDYELFYSQMSNIAHRGGDQPAYVFDYNGKRMALPYDPKDKATTLKIFQQVAAMEKKRKEQVVPPKEEPVTPSNEDAADFSMYSDLEPAKKLKYAEKWNLDSSVNEPHNLEKNGIPSSPNRKKKIIIAGLIFIAIIIIIIGVVGCNSDTSDTANTKTSTTQETTEGRLASLEGTSLVKAMKKLKELGYTAKYYADGVDFTEFIDDMKDDYSVKEIKTNDSEKTATVNIVLTSNLTAKDAEKALSEKISEGAAWSAAKKYGKEKYGDKFDLHHLTGKIVANAEDEKTWFLKAECDVSGESKTCEAKVTGTENDPKVISFDVY